MQDSGPRGTPRPRLQSGGEGNAKQRSQQPERKDSRKRKETPAGGSGSQFAKHPPARVAGGKRVKSARQTTGDSTYAGFNGAVMAAVFRMAVDAPSPPFELAPEKHNSAAAFYKFKRECKAACL